MQGFDGEIQGGPTAMSTERTVRVAVSTSIQSLTYDLVVPPDATWKVPPSGGMLWAGSAFR
ncbi:hypothetical protein AQJ23_16760 [Streptomyces antibioticus]|nr:hypothetical protein AQJ23_16760 [Streptomyces antibioticus]